MSSLQDNGTSEFGGGTSAGHCIAKKEIKEDYIINADVFVPNMIKKIDIISA